MMSDASKRARAAMTDNDDDWKEVEDHYGVSLRETASKGKGGSKPEHDQV